MKLQDKVAIITGAALGIGQAGARLFAQEGAKVVVVDINDREGQATVKSIKEAGGEAYYIHGDTGNVSEIKRVIEKSVEKYGKLDIFWHNAGISGTSGIEGLSEEEFDRMMAVHIKGGFFGIQHAVPELRKTGGGSILFTSSACGTIVESRAVHYTCAKAALNHLARWAASCYAKENIRVNAIGTGLTLTTPVDDPDRIALLDKYASFIPMKRAAQPEEIAAAALFLVSDDASFITGEVLHVDGGRRVWAPAVTDFTSSSTKW